MTRITYSRHAERRAQQRGVPPALAAVVLDHADMEMSLAGGRIALRLSSRALDYLAQDRTPALAEQAKDVVLILAGDVLVTVLRAWGRASRHYRWRRG